MRLIFIALVLIISCVSGVLAQTKPLTVYSAASLRYAMEDVVAVYKEQNPGVQIETIFGSSGKAYAQISNGAPYDIFFSADMNYPQKLVDDGFAVGEVQQYSLGKIAIWQRKGGQLDLQAGLKGLESPNIRKISIANPELAPYGAAAVAAIKKQGLWETLSSKIVMGENISQAAHFAASGAADAAIIAYSLALVPDMINLGESALVDESLYPAMPLGFVVLKLGAENPATAPFITFFKGETGKKIMEKYGY